MAEDKSAKAGDKTKDVCELRRSWRQRRPAVNEHKLAAETARTAAEQAGHENRQLSERVQSLELTLKPNALPN